MNLTQYPDSTSLHGLVCSNLSDPFKFGSCLDLLRPLCSVDGKHRRVPVYASDNFWVAGRRGS